jgi:acetolactate synthase I/II/III large subunit
LKVADAIAHALKAEGVKNLICYPRQIMIDACARADIRPVICRQERVGMGIADGVSRSTYGKSIGVFSMQGGPGAENSFAGIAQAFGDNVPVLVIPGDRVGRSFMAPSFDPIQNFQYVSKWGATVNEPERVPELTRRAFHYLRNGKPGPVILELPSKVGDMEMPAPFEHSPVAKVRSGPDQADVRRVAELLLKAQCPLIVAGQGILYAGATKELVRLAELIQAPVLTTNTGKGAFPEHHPLSIGASVVSGRKASFHFLRKADVVFGMGSSLIQNNWGPKVPKGKTVIHSTNDTSDMNKEFPTTAAVLGDAKLVLEALIAEIGNRMRTGTDVQAEIAAINREWMDDWTPELTSAEIPINQYRIINDLMGAVDPDNTIVTHEAGTPREQAVPFWRCTVPGGYLGWGKSTQLGHGLGLIMGAKLANPDKLCINFMGDASFGMVGMDYETAVRNRLGILTIVFNNGVMAGEKSGLTDAQRYNAADLGGNYSEVARGLGAWSRRISEPDQFLPTLKEAIEATRSNVPALVECVAKQNFKFSRY